MPIPIERERPKDRYLFEDPDQVYCRKHITIETFLKAQNFENYLYFRYWKEKERQRRVKKIEEEM